MKSVMLGGVAMGLVMGCSHYPNMFEDPYANQPPVTTASVEAVQAADVPPSIQDRHGVEKIRVSADGSVVHGPLYFEDPTEECGSEDGRFSVTSEDYLWIVYWRARFLVNLVAFPVSVVDTPPWEQMVSDGRLSCCGRGRQFDAERLCDH